MSRRLYNIVVVVAIVTTTLFQLTASGQPSRRDVRHNVRREVRREVKKYREFLKLIGEHHLDTLDYHALTEAAIVGALSLCDPHSQYIPEERGESLSREIDGAPIEGSYMIDEETLCIKVARFSHKTAEMIGYKYHEAGSPPRLVLDLRGNKGGLVYEAKATAELFLNRGDVIFTRMGRTIPTQSFAAERDGSLRGVELMLVIDRESASAAEIVVGALNDHGQAIVAGERSFGKGLILKQFKLNDDSSVLIAIAHYLTPNLKDIQRKYRGKNADQSVGGISPSIEFTFDKTIDAEDVNVLFEKK